MDPNLLWLVPVLLVAGWILLKTLRPAPGDSGAVVVHHTEKIPQQTDVPAAAVILAEGLPGVIIRRKTPMEAAPVTPLVAPVGPSKPDASPTSTVEPQAPVPRKPRFLLDTPEAVQQAIIFQEILGPPLCRRGPGGLPRRDR
jgi:hypothetical protein